MATFGEDGLMAVKIWRNSWLLFLLALTAEPCSMAHVRTPWAKKPGAESKLFAFEKNGRVGFIDPTGRVIIKPTIVASIDSVGDFSNGLARIDNQGYINESGQWAIKQALWSMADFSDGAVLAMQKRLKHVRLSLLFMPWQKHQSRQATSFGSF